MYVLGNGRGVAREKGRLVIEGALELRQFAAEARIAEAQRRDFERGVGSPVAQGAGCGRRTTRVQVRVEQLLVPARVDRAQFRQRAARRSDGGKVHCAGLPVKECPAAGQNQRREAVTEDAKDANGRAREMGSIGDDVRAPEYTGERVDVAVK